MNLLALQADYTALIRRHPDLRTPEAQRAYLAGYGIHSLSTADDMLKAVQALREKEGALPAAPPTPAEVDPNDYDARYEANAGGNPHLTRYTPNLFTADDVPAQDTSDPAGAIKLGGR